MIESFPIDPICRRNDADKPGITAYGKRFFGDQQILDLLAEFLLVLCSDKQLIKYKIDKYIPSIEILNQWVTLPEVISYFPKARLNLKLFSFIGASDLETRHPAHREHAIELWKNLGEKTDLSTDKEKMQFIKTLNQLFLGFWGNGSRRTWCAQTFFPFCKTVLCSEVIWSDTNARKDHIMSWSDIESDKFSNYFRQSQNVIFCKGGEALYLHVCNALTIDNSNINLWINNHRVSSCCLGFTEIERNKEKLRDVLISDLDGFFSQTPKMLEYLMEFVDTGVDDKTAEKSDFDNIHNPRGVQCAWIPRESWREGYIFSVELHRVLSAKIGLIEKINLLQTCCALQVMRTLAAQSYRLSQTKGGAEDGFDYRIFLCEPSAQNRKLRSLSAQSHTEIAREIQQAIRVPEIYNCLVNTVEPSKIEAQYKQADNQYGFKLYRKIGKALGLIVPPKGGQMRYTLNDRLLKYLIVSTLPGQRMTLDSFKKQVELHHGFVFDPEQLSVSRNWANTHLESLENNEGWLERMLEASGVLVKLSDACSLVKNPYAAQKI